MPDVYSFTLNIHERNIRTIDYYEDIAKVTIKENESPMAAYGRSAPKYAVVLSDAEWKISKNNS